MSIHVAVAPASRVYFVASGLVTIAPRSISYSNG
jgi:hypothetical protein